MVECNGKSSRLSVKFRKCGKIQICVLCLGSVDLVHYTSAILSFIMLVNYILDKTGAVVSYIMVNVSKKCQKNVSCN